MYESDCPIFETPEKIAYYLDESNLRSAKEKATILQRFVPSGARILDVGSNYGHFLRTIANIYDGVGLEISPRAVTWSVDNFHVKNYWGSVYEFPKELNGPFDGITMWDVVEHLDDPASAICQIMRHLRDKGWFVLSTPDTSSLTARLLGRYWHHVDPEQHVNLFSRKNLTGLLQDHGFSVEHVSYIGHYYRAEYVIRKLGGLFGLGFRNEKASALFARSIGRITIYLKLFDVMVVVSRKHN